MLLIPKLLLEQRGRLEPRLNEIGDEWEDCLAVVSYTTDSGFFHQSLLELPRETIEWGSNIVIWGETPHGYDGLPYVLDLLNKNSSVNLLISGGEYSRREFFNEVGAIDLFNKLYAELNKRGWSDRQIKEGVVIDSMSLHTGHQRIIVGHLLSSLAPQKVFPVITNYHMPRFIMSISVPLYKNVTRTKVVPVPYGAWETRHPLKGPLDKPEEKFTHEELLCLPPTPSPVKPSVLSKDEYVQNCGELDKIIQYAEEGQCLTFKQAREFLGV